MQGQDRLFIVLAVVLMLLFAAKISSNLSRSDLESIEVGPRQEDREKRDKLLTDLRKAGLEPREARYYEVINE